MPNLRSMQLSFRFILLLVLLTVITSQRPLAQSLEPALRAAREHRWTDVLKIVGPITKSKKAPSQAWLLKGMALDQLGRHAEATEIGRRLVQTNPSSLQYYLFLSENLQRSHKLDSSIIVLKEAETRFHDSVQVQYALGFAYAAAGAWDLAISPLEETMMRKPGNINVMMLLADSYARIQEHAPAADLYGRIADMQPTNVAARRALGVSLMQMDQSDSAIVILSSVMKDDPHNRTIAPTYAAALNAAKRYPEAIVVLRQFVQQYPSEPDAWYNLGIAQQNAGEADSSVRSFKKAIVLRPSFAEAYFNMALAYDSRGFSEDAMQAFQRAALLKKELAPASYNSIAIIYRSQSKIDEALAAHMQAMALAPDDARAVVALGYTYYISGMFAEGIKFLEESRKKFPSELDILTPLGQCYVRTGRFDEARAIIATLTPTKPSAAASIQEIMK